MFIRRTIFSMAFLLSMSGLVQADVKLDVAEGIEVLAVNGELSTENAAFNSGEPLMLDNGANQLLVQYGTEIQIAGDDPEYSVTDVFVLLFDLTDTGATLKAPKIKRLRDLDKFNRAPIWQITQESGGAVSLQVAKLKKEGFQLNRDYQAELAEFNRGLSPAVLPPLAAAADIKQQAVAAVTSKSKQARSLNQVSNGEAEMALDMLKYWYQKADQKTRASFQQWIQP